jgi:hypothetical protein
LAIETNSKISLISKAMILTGEPPVESLSDPRYGVVVLANIFEQLYESLLQSNRWRFAMKKGAFSRLVVEPLNEWRYAYQIPPDCLILIGQTYPQPYEVYGDRVYTNSSTFEAEYMFKPEINKCPAYFTLLLTYVLAADSISPITENEAKARLMEMKLIRQRGIASYADAQSRPAKTVIDSPFVQVR